MQFKLEGSAQAILLQANHRIGDVDLEITAADDCLQPNFELILRKLNDDCLKEVFLRLKLGDLCNVANVCRRFKNAANWAFTENFKSLDFEAIRVLDYGIIQDQSIIDELFEKTLRNFGSLIYSMTTIIDEKELELVSRHCIDKSNNSNLKAIKFGEVRITNKVVERFRNIFKNLNELRFYETTFAKDFSNFFPLTLCTELETLFFSISPPINRVLTNLIISNPKIKDLSIHIEERISNVAQFFERCFNEPIELMTCFNHKCLSSLTMLNELTLHFNYYLVYPVLKSLVDYNIPIQYLCLIEGVMDDLAIESICQLKQINTLHLHTIYSSDLNGNHLVRLGKNLPELENLSSCQCSMEMDSDSLKCLVSYAKNLKSLKIGMQGEATIELSEYNTILEIVKSRDVRIPLEIELIESEINVPEDIRLKNETWLDIHSFNGKKGFSLEIFL